jgi:[CysO sulfur-carrier protein]-S-L-cysteine hydrolase
VSRLPFLWLTEAQAQQIAEHARSEAPREACGLIAGQGSQAVWVVRVANTAADPVHHYAMDNAALSRFLPEFAKSGLELIGIYHSHPKSAPFPSSEDIDRAFYPNTAYLIVSLRGQSPKLAAWLIENGRVKPLKLHIGTLPSPDTTPLAEPLASSGKIAVILSALLAFLLLIVLSLSLLPPAPPIPN